MKREMVVKRKVLLKIEKYKASNSTIQNYHTTGGIAQAFQEEVVSSVTALPFTV